MKFTLKYMDLDIWITLTGLNLSFCISKNVKKH